jgi:hypothetical protein
MPESDIRTGVPAVLEVPRVVLFGGKPLNTVEIIGPVDVFVNETGNSTMKEMAK